MNWGRRRCCYVGVKPLDMAMCVWSLELVRVERGLCMLCLKSASLYYELFHGRQMS